MSMVGTWKVRGEGGDVATGMLGVWCWDGEVED